MTSWWYPLKDVLTCANLEMHLAPRICTGVGFSKLSNAFETSQIDKNFTLDKFLKVFTLSLYRSLNYYVNPTGMIAKVKQLEGITRFLEYCSGSFKPSTKESHNPAQIPQLSTNAYYSSF